MLEKTLESPLDCKRSNQSILREMSPGYSLEGLMLKLKLQYFSHLMRRADSLEKTLMLGGKTLGVGDGQGGLVCCTPWGRKESDTTGQLNNKFFSEKV